MGLKFQYRSTQLAAWYAPGGSDFSFYSGNNSDAAPTIDDSVLTGVFGGKLLNLAPPSTAYHKGAIFKGFANTPSTLARSYLMRVVPQFTGVPPSVQAIISTGLGPNSFIAGVVVWIDTAGIFNYYETANNGSTSVAYASPNPVTLTENVPTDFLITWDGTTGANAVNVYQDGVLLSSGPGNYAGYTPIPGICSSIGLGYGAEGFSPSMYYNEICIWEGVQSVSYPRTDFISASKFDGTVSTDPGIANVVQPTAYSINGVSLVGTFVNANQDPGIANVKAGVGYEIDGVAKVGTYNLWNVTAGDDTEDPMTCTILALKTFMAENIQGLTVLDEWPYANQKLVYPSVTITAPSNPKRMPEMPYQVSVTTPDENGKVIANEVVANWDNKIQLDLWCSSKQQRRQFTNSILALFNAKEVDLSGDNNADGLALQVATLFNEWVRYEIDTLSPMDDEAAAQRQERRMKIMVIVNFREVRQRTYYAIKNVQVLSQVTPEEVDFSDDTNDTELNNIPSS